MVVLKEIMDLTKVNISLSDTAQNIEVHDDFKTNPTVKITDTEITIECFVDNVTRAINFNFDKNTISEIFTSEIGIGGEVYSMNGEIIKLIN
jgi:hypothetical protein